VFAAQEARIEDERVPEIDGFAVGDGLLERRRVEVLDPMAPADCHLAWTR